MSSDAKESAFQSVEHCYETNQGFHGTCHIIRGNARRFSWDSEFNHSIITTYFENLWFDDTHYNHKDYPLEWHHDKVLYNEKINFISNLALKNYNADINVNLKTKELEQFKVCDIIIEFAGHPLYIEDQEQKNINEQKDLSDYSLPDNGETRAIQHLRHFPLQNNCQQFGSLTKILLIPQDKVCYNQCKFIFENGTNGHETNVISLKLDNTVEYGSVTKQLRCRDISYHLKLGCNKIQEVTELWSEYRGFMSTVPRNVNKDDDSRVITIDFGEDGLEVDHYIMARDALFFFVSGALCGLQFIELEIDYAGYDPYGGPPAKIESSIHSDCDLKYKIDHL